MEKMRQLLDPAEDKATSSKKPKLDGPDDMDQDQAHGISSPEKFVHETVAAVKNMRSISAQTEAEQRPRKGVESNSQSKIEPELGEGEGGEGLVQDQLILAPEIMKIILEHLDLRALKQVRLVCKSWLLEAHAHVERRGIVWLDGDTSESTSVLDFMETRYTKIPALPQPFQSVNVDLVFSVDEDENNYYDREKTSPQSDATFRQLSKLCPSNLITRLSTQGLPSKFAYPLIRRCASRLEYLKLFASDCQQDERDLPLRNEEGKFLKLRHLHVNCFSKEDTSTLDQWDGFPHFVAWVLKAGPNVDIFQLWGGGSDTLDPSNEVLAEVDLGNVKTLKLGGFKVFSETFNPFISNPYYKLRNLSMTHLADKAPEALLTIVTASALALKMLNIRGTRLTADVVSGFPVCPTVQELHMNLFPGWQDFVSRCFPSLKNFSTFLKVSPPHLQDRRVPRFQNDQEVFSSSPTFQNVKTLKIQLDHSLMTQAGPHICLGPVKLFTNFPALESLCIPESLLLDYSDMKTGGDYTEFLHLFQGLKHLEIDRYRYYTPSRATDTSFSFLAKLRGIGSLELTQVSQVIQMPVREMPSLKLLRFPWGEGVNLEKLLKIISEVERVAITNCCSAPKRWMNSKSQGLLEKFFQSAQNAVCGCKDGKMSGQ